MTLNTDPANNDGSITTQDFTPQTEQPGDPSMKMNADEFKELRDAVANVAIHDVQAGRLFGLIVHHLGHLHGFDAATEDAKLRKQAKEEEDKETKEQEQAEEDKKAKEQTLLNATPAYSASADSSTPAQEAPTDVPVDQSTATQEGVQNAN